MLNEIVLSHKALATVGPIALKPPPGVNVLMCVQMGFRPEPFSAVIPIANVWLVCVTARVAPVRVTVRFA